MRRCGLVLFFLTLLCYNLLLLDGKRSPCEKSLQRVQKKDPRFRIQPGTVTCHELALKSIPQCNGQMLFPKKGPLLKHSDYSEPISDAMALLDQNVTWKVGGGGSGCGYRRNVQCTWRFPLDSSNAGYVLLWRSAIEHQQDCTNDYMVVDIFVDKSVRGQTVPTNCVPVPRASKLCRLEYKMGCGSHCDPTYSADKCSESGPTCPGHSASCQSPPTGIFRVSTTQPELSSLKIDYIHVTFFSDSSITCSGFSGMYAAFEKGWSGLVNFGTLPKECCFNMTMADWLNNQTDFLPGFHHGIINSDFHYGQMYSSDDRLRVLARSGQDSAFFNKVKNHTIFGDAVSGIVVSG